MSTAHPHDVRPTNPPERGTSSASAQELCSPSAEADQGSVAKPALSPLWQHDLLEFDGKQYTRHACANIIPSASDSENLAFQEDVRRRGQLASIYVSGTEVVDGWRRLIACLAAGHRPRFGNVKDDDALATCLRQNIHRRHLSPGQRAAIAAYLQDWTQACGHGGVRDQAVVLRLDRAADRRALSGSGEKTQASADFVAQKSVPLIKQVIAGSLSLDKAVAKLKSEAVGEAQVDRPDPHARCKHRFEEAAAKEAQFETLLASRDAEIFDLKHRISMLEDGRPIDDLEST